MEKDRWMSTLEEIILKNSQPLLPLATGMTPEANQQNGIRAVLFDVYGTLFISGSGDVGTAAATDTAEALTQALAAAGFQGDLDHAGELGNELLKSEILERHRISRAAGVEFPEVEIAGIWKKIIETLCRTEAVKRCDAGMDQIRRLGIEYECRVNPVYPMPGCIETLRRLRERGLVMGIVSNAQFYTPLLFSAFFGNRIEALGFDPECCIWSYRELEAKPSALLFAKAEQFLKKNHGIRLSETLYVGNDMLNDMFTASRAGCRTVLFAGDRRSLRLRKNDARCAHVKPDAVVTALDQLPALL